jgi:hypothetical protein
MPDPKAVIWVNGTPPFEIVDHKSHGHFTWVRWRNMSFEFDGYFVDRHAAGRYLVTVRREAYAKAVMRRLAPEMP